MGSLHNPYQYNYASEILPYLSFLFKTFSGSHSIDLQEDSDFSWP